MELGKQIKKYRGELGLSQEALAEKIYVSRQTVSNWENDKNYPDINSLLRLSEVFQVSVDILIKGDVEKMKVEIRQQDRQQFEMDGVNAGYAIDAGSAAALSGQFRDCRMGNAGGRHRLLCVQGRKDEEGIRYPDL